VAFRELVDSGRMQQMQNHADRIGGYIGMTISAVDYLQAQRVRKHARIAIDQMLSKYDAVLGPTTPSVRAASISHSIRLGDPRATRQNHPIHRGPIWCRAGTSRACQRLRY
jgi:Asp-tRNA(Asn)/Glu-tRNA(Gln) amidotransferase A subunit family amidase